MCTGPQCAPLKKSRKQMPQKKYQFVGGGEKGLVKSITQKTRSLPGKTLGHFGHQCFIKVSYPTLYVTLYDQPRAICIVHRHYYYVFCFAPRSPGVDNELYPDRRPQKFFLVLLCINVQVVNIHL